jgi:Xaa-Pro aminopeptidase
VQALAQRCAMEIALNLTAGVTERQAADALEALLRRSGASGFFHQPFAWFGDRTCFQGFRSALDFFPTDRRIERGMAAILDVAPVVDGVCADIGYSFSLGDNAELARLRDELDPFHELITSAIDRNETIGDVYRAVDARIVALGLRNCHQVYPFGVLAHRVFEIGRWPGLGRPILGFGLGASVPLLSRAVAARVGRAGAAFCTTGKGSDRSFPPGLWAFEPHVARGAVGAKWEELLVIDERGARWLRDEIEAR